MKKFITAAALLAAGTAFANADWSVANSVSTLVDNYYYNGIAFDLSVEENSRLTVTGGTLDDTVYLTSFGTNLREPPSGYEANLSLMICDSNNTILGVSNESVAANNSNVTWTFTDLEISTNSVVFAYFIGASSVDSALASVGSVASDTSWLVRCGGGTSGVIDYGNTTGVESLYLIGNNNNTNYTYEEKVRYAPIVNMTLTAIPEPSAFGLLAGVGALALVAARRRRSK